MSRFFLFGRLLQFRNELVALGRAFFDARTPLYLKGAMLALVAYLVSPIDLVPEFIPFLGLVDDIVLVPFAVNWIFGRLAPEVGAKPVRATVRRR